MPRTPPISLLAIRTDLLRRSIIRAAISISRLPEIDGGWYDDGMLNRAKAISTVCRINPPH